MNKSQFIIVIMVFGYGLSQKTEKCNYSKETTGIYANCSSRHLTFIPKNIRPDTDILDLSNNLLQTIPNNSFDEITGMEKLILRNNSISKLGMYAFQGLKHLRYLDLSSNRLTYNYDTFDKELFIPLCSLEVLHIHDNLSGDNSTYLDEAVVFCEVLSELYVDGIENTSFGPGYLKLKKLRNLNLSAGKKCNIGVLKNETFNNTIFLTRLQLKNCGLKKIYACAFCPLTYMQYLDLSGNTPGGLRLIRNVTYGLNRTKTEVLEFNDMESGDGLGKEIKRSDLEFAFNTPIKNLSVSGNQIELFETGAVSLMPKHLTFLDCSDNRFKFGQYIFEMKSLAHLQETVGDYINTYHRYKKDQTEGSDLANKGANNSTCFSLPPNLENVYIRYSYIQYYIPEISFCNNSLRVLELHHNTFNVWKGPVQTLNSLRYLDLSVNFCDEISDDFFDYMPVLESLKIRGNFLGLAIETNQTCPWFSPLSHLKKLDLSLNHIKQISKQCLTALTSLQTLNLSENSLSDWEIDITHMPNISTLDLAGNSLDGFPKDTRNHLSKIAKRQTVSINLKDNQLECTCDNLAFLEWFESADIDFIGRENYTCRKSTWNQIPMRNLPDILSKLRKKCYNYAFLNTILFILIFGFLFGVLYAIFYRYRWKLRYLYYITWGKHSLLNDDKKKYLYDAFISYAEEDSKFVKQELVPRLERTYGLSLCLHERDFIPGRYIRANIVNAIENSRKTIIILTSSYLKSHWCMFEFNMAIMEKIHKRSGTENSFVVKLHDFNVREMDANVLDLLRSESYIEYPQHTEDISIFWLRLKETIKPRNSVS